MNMHGIFALAPEQLAETRPSFRERALTWVKARRSFLLVVMLPTLLAATYYYLIAANQYVSEAHFSVRSAGTTVTAPTGFGALLGVAGASGEMMDPA